MDAAEEARRGAAGAGGGRLADVAMVGLGVMGRNLALNLSDHGHAVAVHDRDPRAVARRGPP